MRRFPVALAITIFTVIMVIIGYFVYANDELTRARNVAHVGAAPSQIYARLLIRYDKPPIYEEEYRMQDIEGVSRFDYRIRSYSGKQITIMAPSRAVYDVSFFFGKLDQDGVWQIVDKPPRGNVDIHYTVYVKQLADFKQGQRTVTFTDPHYWATTAGRQYNIDLSKQDPRDLLKMQSTQLADPHYQAAIDDFRAFGPDLFRARIAAAQKAVRSGK